MRDILFRGKRKDNGEWIEGYYADVAKNNMILTGRVDITETVGAEVFRIIPETVGQFTGVTDQNGKKIFEWDIVKRGDRIWVIEYDVKCAQFVMKTYTESGVFRIRAFDLIPSEWCEVIGNIYDNPELLENNNLEEHKNGQNQHT